MSAAKSSVPSGDAASRSAPVLTRDKAISPADFAAVLTELRNSGIKPNPADISRALRKKGFVTTDRSPEDKIVHLSDASVPEQEIFAARARQYESGLDESLQEVDTLQQELQQYRKAMPDLLSREADLLHQLELATGKLLTLETENAATPDLGTQLQEALDREASLKIQLEEIDAGTALSESLSRDLAEQRALMATLRQREQELTAQLQQAAARASLTDFLEEELRGLRAKLEEQEQENRRRTESLAKKAGEDAAALKDSQRRQAHLEQELAELRYQFHEAAEVAPAALAAQLEAARQEAREHEAGLEQSRVQLQRLESALAEAAQRETEFLARAEDAARQAARAEEHHEFLQAELSKAQQAPRLPVKPAAAPEPDENLRIHLESAAFGKYLAEVIEGELHRQTTALTELTRRETELREQLEKAKPRSNKAQSLESELTSQGLFREDMTRRKDALVKLLAETIASLRTQSAAEAAEVPPAE